MTVILLNGKEYKNVYRMTFDKNSTTLWCGGKKYTVFTYNIKEVVR